jgi:DNA-binding transcriptional ArsR family regulator
MLIERVEPTPAQIKAAANSLRLRILRLCNDREWTNKELAERLERDPATIHHHVRLLVDAGLLEPTGVRQGPTGAYEKPYRSTGLSWQISFGDTAYVPDEQGELIMLQAFREELAEAGYDSMAEMSRFHLHLSDDELQTFITRLTLLLDEYRLADPPRQAQGAPSYGGLVALHRLARTSTQATEPNPPLPADPDR